MGPSLHALMTHHDSDIVIAIVDDDESVLKALEYLLESADYAPRLFTSGTALLNSGGLAEIDCVISDIDMPDMDGFELLQAIHESRPGMPAILITGYPDRLKRLPPFGGMAPRFFTKPFPAPELLAAVRDALQEHRD